MAGRKRKPAHGGSRAGAGAPTRADVASTAHLGPIKLTPAERVAVLAALESRGLTLSEAVRRLGEPGNGFVAMAARVYLNILAHD